MGSGASRKACCPYPAMNWSRLSGNTKLIDQLDPKKREAEAPRR